MGLGLVISPTKTEMHMIEMIVFFNDLGTDITWQVGSQVLSASSNLSLKVCLIFREPGILPGELVQLVRFPVGACAQ